MKKKETADFDTNESNKIRKDKKNKISLTPEEAEAKKALNTVKIQCIAAILCAVIVALSISSAFGKMSEAITPATSASLESDDEFGLSMEEEFFADEEAVAADTDLTSEVTSAESNTIADESLNDTTDKSTDSSVENTDATPLTYSKAQLIAYYNSCLKKSYAQPKMNATKTEFVDVSVSGIDIGSFDFDVDSIVQNIVDKNTTANNKPQTKSFVNGEADDGVLASKFVLPVNLYDGAVKNIKATKQGSGYKILILLNQESCPYTELPPFNSSCAWPLDFTVIDFGWALAIHNCTFNYPGTLLTATVDEQDRVTSVKVEMPLTIENASGKAISLVNIHVDSIKGKWTCTNEMTF